MRKRPFSLDLESICSRVWNSYLFCQINAPRTRYDRALENALGFEIEGVFMASVDFLLCTFLRIHDSVILIFT